MIKSKSPLSNIQGQGISDRPGAGGGWFGGFSSHNHNGGSGGGSSWILSENSIIPSGNIAEFGSFYEFNIENPYAFPNKDRYLFTDSIIIPGIWAGSGRVVITVLSNLICSNIHSYFNIKIIFLLFVSEIVIA